MKNLIVLIFVSSAFAQTPAPGSVTQQSWSLITEALGDKNPDTRVQAVQSMGLIGAHEPYIKALEGMLDDKDVEVRLATVTSLVDLKNKGTVAALKKALNEDIPEVSFAAAKALWVLKDPDGQDALISVLSGETKASSGFITKQKREALRMLHTPRPLMMFAIKAGAGFAPVPGLGAGISSLQGILSDPSMSGRAATALLLSSEKDPRVLAALLDDKKASVRLRAAAGCLRLESLPVPVKRAVAPKAAAKADAKK
jgi:HEAT repeat protein